MTTTKLLLALALTLLPACQPHGVERALDAANAALGATRVAVDEAADVHKQLVIDATRACADELGATSTSAERKACLEKRGFSPEQIADFERALDKVAEGYDMIVEAMGLIEQGWSDVQQHLAGAR